MIKNSAVVIAIFSVFLLPSCNGKDIYYQTYNEIDNESWSAESPQTFEFEIEDTTKLYDFFFNLRNTNSYEYRNIFVFWKLESPDGKTKTDTAQFILADRKGKWLGNSASGTLVDNSMWFLKAKLGVQGKYAFTFVQGMREEELKSVKDVGLKILKANESK